MKTVLKVLCCSLASWLTLNAGWCDQEHPEPLEDVQDAREGKQVSTVAIGIQLRDAYALLKGGQHQKALELFEEVVAQDPDNKRARSGMGTSYIGLGRYEDAIELMEPMVQSYPDDFFIKNNLAWLYATAENPAIRNGQKATALAQDALLLAPNDYHVWSTLAEAHYVSANYDKAVRAAEQALRLSDEKNVPMSEVRIYLRQIMKCRQAAKAMSILE